MILLLVRPLLPTHTRVQRHMHAHTTPVAAQQAPDATLDTHVTAGSKRGRDKAWRSICAMGAYAASSRRRRSLRASARGHLDAVTKYITAGLSAGSLSRISSWSGKLQSFLLARARRLGHPRVTPEMMADVNNMLAFLAFVADQKKGRTRVSAALRAINFVRRLLALRPLADDPRVTLLVEGVRRLQPHLPKGAIPLPVILLSAVADTWGASKVWWKRMVATILIIAFLSLMRGAGILTVPDGTVTWVYGLHESRTPPRPESACSGALVLIPARKTTQTAPSWVPIREGRATQLLAAHVRWRKSSKNRNKFLFPSRRRRRSKDGRVRWAPHHSNRMSQASFVTLMRHALVQVCGMSERSARRFTIHSVRVGGINYYKRIGVPIGMRAIIASHKSLVTSRKYLRLLPAERLDELSTMVPHE